MQRLAVQILLASSALLLVAQGFTIRLDNGPESNETEADYYSMVIDYAGVSSRSKRNTYAPFGYRPGDATETNSCQHVRGVPQSLRSKTNMKPNGLGYFYQKYTEAYGIPVVSSNAVSDDALRRGCYVLRFLLADNAGVRHFFYKLFGRVAVIGVNEGTTSIPENRYLSSWWNQRARGLGAMPTVPCSSGGEENLLCLKGDRYYNEDIFLHESSHGVQLIGADFAIKGFTGRLKAAYDSAKRTGKWRSTYAMTNPREYWAEGVQSFFNVNAYANPPNGIHNHVHTRSVLKTYDPILYKLILEVFPCENHYIKRCGSTRAKENNQKLKMNCKPGGVAGKVVGGGSKKKPTKPSGTSKPTVSKATPKPTSKPKVIDKFPHCKDEYSNCASRASSGQCRDNPEILGKCRRTCNVCGPKKNINCVDRNSYCKAWAQRGECDINPGYMNLDCVKSCLCDR